MGKITITMDIDPGYADEAHATGVTEAGYTELIALLNPLGDNIDVSRAE